MNTSILAIVGTILAIILLFVERFMSVKAEKRKLAEQAKKDLNEAINNDNRSALLDAFSRLR